MVVNPPQKGDDSYALFEKEKSTVLNNQFKKATMIKEAFKEMDSVECFGRIGALYLFPRLNKLPDGKNEFCITVWLFLKRQVLVP